MTAVVAVLSLAVGINLWFLFEYLLHRFAMHYLHGKGMMSREHLEHHVQAGWSFSYTHILSWLGVGLVGGAIWLPVGYLIGGWTVGIPLAIGWPIGYAFYEYEHAMCHLQPPRTRYQRWVRKHHFQHHFGSPMDNQGVSVGWWDVLFGTNDAPDIVRVPRRMAAGLDWLIDEDGELRPEFADDYELVGSYGTDERQAGIDRAKAFASIAPDA
ncbi:MAG: sterol desaturase family protein [Microthrixaceae bacterium]|nr:sterol desaturase family protein [Microthrixaceae bacterium]MCO5321561.1 sterol desaturase family protein [Microthrixaceae bacterium]